MLWPAAFGWRFERVVLLKVFVKSCSYPGDSWFRWDRKGYLIVIYRNLINTPKKSQYRSIKDILGRIDFHLGEFLKTLQRLLKVKRNPWKVKRAGPSGPLTMTNSPNSTMMLLSRLWEMVLCLKRKKRRSEAASALKRNGHESWRSNQTR